MISTYLKKKVGGFILASALLPGIAAATTITAQAQSPWNRDRQERRYNNYDRDDRWRDRDDRWRDRKDRDDYWRREREREREWRWRERNRHVYVNPRYRWFRG